MKKLLLVILTVVSLQSLGQVDSLSVQKLESMEIRMKQLEQEITDLKKQNRDLKIDLWELSDARAPKITPARKFRVSRTGSKQLEKVVE